MHELDILARGLKAVFCGINRPPTATHAGHNFSSPSNRFWTVLHRAGFTDVLLQSTQERRLLDYGYGITAVARRVTATAAEVSTREFKQAQPRFEAQMRRCAPRALAFLGKRAYAAMTDRTELAWGLQPKGLAGAMVWILPNPSGLNRNFTLDALVNAYSELRTALDH